jgi:hypothetical protein
MCVTTKNADVVTPPDGRTHAYVWKRLDRMLRESRSL